MHNPATIDTPRRDLPDRPTPTGKFLIPASVFLISFFILFSRRPDAVLNAQFYAEDGVRWFADAYHLGWRCLLLPETGYLQTVSRLVGLFSLLFPLSVAPLVMNLCALIVQILPVNLLFSSRFRALPILKRLIGGLLYLAIPNSIEVHANTTNIQWHLALLACLVLLAKPPIGRIWVFLDLSVLVLVALDSPLGFLCVAMAAVLWWTRREVRDKWSLAALVPGALLQLLVVTLSHSRFPVQNGVTLARLTGILGGQIFLSSLLGVRTFAQLFLFADRHFLFYTEAVAMILGLALFFFSFRYATIELRLFLLFAIAVLILALSHPIAGPDRNFPQWEYMQIPGRSSRYYFFPILAFYASLLSTLGITGSMRVKAMRSLAVGVLALVPIGIYKDWHYPRFAELHFQAYASQFERAAPGTRITIPINPVGWELQLTKH